MEVAEPEVYPMDLTAEQIPEPEKRNGRRWLKHWVPQDTILGAGSCLLLKWITEDALNSFQTKPPVDEHQEPEDQLEVVYLCTYDGCGKIFSENAALRKHAHVHGEKQYICQYEGCGKRFVDSSKLKRHFLIHTGEKHFICPFENCGKAFSLDFNLRSHMRTHTGENYHICPYDDCGKRYAHEYKLKAHVRSAHEKNVQEITAATSPGTDPERDVAPKYISASTAVAAAPPPPSNVALEKPYFCRHEGCNKRYIHEYKLNLHLKNAHPPTPKKGGSSGEDEIEEDSEQDVFQEVVPKFYDQVLKASEPTPKKRGSSKPSGKGKLRIISKPPAVSGAKRKRPNVAPVEPNLKLHVKHGNASKSEMSRQDLKPDIADDSEETEDEDRENTEEEDNVQHMSGVNIQHMGGGMGEEDDEETEDDMD